MTKQAGACRLPTSRRRTTGAISARHKHMALRNEEGQLIDPLPEFRSGTRPEKERRLKDEGEIRTETPSPARRRRRRRPASSVLRAAGAGRQERPTALPSTESIDWPQDFPRDGDWIEQLWYALRHDTQALHAVILNRTGIDFREPHLAEEGHQMEPQTDAVSLDPFGAAFPLGDGRIFLLELLGGFREGGFGLQNPRRQLAAQAKQPILRRRLGLLKSGFLGAHTILAAF